MLMHAFLTKARTTAAGLAGVVVLVATGSPSSLLANEVGRHFIFQQGSVIGDLQCPVKRKPSQAPGPARGDVLEPPDAEELDELGILTSRLNKAPGAEADTVQSATMTTRPGTTRTQPLRIGIWGDSHLAAGSFSYELKRIFLAQGLKARTQFIPFTMGRAGVNLPLRRHCMDGWKSDLAYVARNTDIPTGVGLNVLQGDAEAYLWFDLRNENGEADVSRVELFFHQSPGAGSVSISIDDGPENKVSLSGPKGFGSLSIVGNRPLSLLKIRVTDPPVQLNGMFLNYRQPPAATLDSFGIPGATVRAWQQLDPDYFSGYFKDRSYDLVMLEYGTNEGNATSFDAAGYAKTLEQSLKNMRQVFPQSECLLIAPGDRGILVPRVRKVKKAGKVKPSQAQKAQQGRTVRARVSYDYTAVDLLRFSAIHEKIFAIQKELGARYACKTWSMQTAMGGQGSAYAWQLANPALMSKDLIHFTIKGYQRLAQELASSLGWNSDAGLPASVMPPEKAGDDGTPK